MSPNYRAVFTVTFRVEADDIADFAKKLAAWGRVNGYTVKWAGVEDGRRVDDVEIGSRPLILYTGTFDHPECGVTLIPKLPTVRVSYFVGVDDSAEQVFSRADEMARELAEVGGVNLAAASWDLYGKADDAPYVLLESGMFKGPEIVVAAREMRCH